MYDLVIAPLFSRHSTAIYQKFVIINIQFHYAYSVGKVLSELYSTQLVHTSPDMEAPGTTKNRMNEETDVKYGRMVKTT